MKIENQILRKYGKKGNSKKASPAKNAVKYNNV